MRSFSNHDPRTLSVHAGLEPDPVTGAIAPNVVTASNFAFQPDGVAFSANLNPDMTALPFFYSRWTNPTVRQLEQRIAALEGAEDGIATASGMAAAAALFFGVLKAGDHVIVSDVCYPGVRELASDILSDLGIASTAVNLSDLAAVRAAIRPATKLIHAETPCNPLMRLTDLAALADIAREAGCLLSVDSTVATPVATRPIELGADIVIHSLTKFINGHGDALGGMLLGKKSLIEPIRARVAVRLGASLSAQSAWLILRGVDTLYPRMEAIERNAQKIAEGLEAHPAIVRVIYPGLASHPQADLARRQMKNFSGMMTFQTKADPNAVARAIAGEGGTKLVHYAVSLGHQRSNLVLMRTDELMQSTFKLEGDALADYRRYAGDGVFRFSVGLEAPDDVLADLFSVLDRFR
jgi:methionine-gamma-lyase